MFVELFKSHVRVRVVPHCVRGVAGIVSLDEIVVQSKSLKRLNKVFTIFKFQIIFFCMLKELFEDIMFRVLGKCVVRGEATDGLHKYAQEK